jgi:beta-aspartyl-peptidase (threonine type)
MNRETASDTCLLRSDSCPTTVDRSFPMRRITFAILAGMLPMTVLHASSDDLVNDVVLGVHGGTGMDKKDVTPELDRQFRSVLTDALKAGKARLDAGGTSLDAVETAIRVMEDAPVLNAGRGAVFTRDGRNELDASIMEGRQKRAGAVAGVQVVKNPISAARAVMERSKHVMFIGRNAETFAAQQGLELVDPSYFWTEMRWKAIQEIWKKDAEEQKKRGAVEAFMKVEYGTVGAVALDRQGDLAAGTSTGGMTGKMPGRVGDSPIIGAGTYADNAAAAISCTGHGEYFIRYAVSHEIVAQMKYKGLAVNAAADDVINRQLKDAGGEGAAIALDKTGRFAAAYNSEGLYRGCITTDGTIRVRLYAD